METQLLEDLITLAETRSFRRAADRRQISQPAFSRRIKSLEEWAGVRLVDRSSQSVQLTPAGQLLRWKAVDALQCLQTAQFNLSQLEKNPHA